MYVHGRTALPGRALAGTGPVSSRGHWLGGWPSLSSCVWVGCPRFGMETLSPSNPWTRREGQQLPGSVEEKWFSSWAESWSHLCSKNIFVQSYVRMVDPKKILPHWLPFHFVQTSRHLWFSRYKCQKPCANSPSRSSSFTSEDEMRMFWRWLSLIQIYNSGHMKSI